MTKAITQTINTANEYRLHISYFMIGLCSLLVFAYCMNIYSVVSKSTSANLVMKNAQVLENSVKTLDAKYIEMTSNMTKQSLMALGMTEGKVTAFIVKSHSSGIVALR